MYLRDIVKQEFSTKEFLEAIKQDFVLSNQDLPILTELTKKYEQETHNNFNYFIHTATFINYIANKMIRMGVPEKAGKDFRLLVPIYKEFYDFKESKNISITDTKITMSKIKNQFSKFLMPYNDRNQLPNIRGIIVGTVYEFEILGKYSNGDSIASHCMGSAARDVYRPLEQEFFSKFTY